MLFELALKLERELARRLCPAKLEAHLRVVSVTEFHPEGGGLRLGFPIDNWLLQQRTWFLCRVRISFWLQQVS